MRRQQRMLVVAVSFLVASCGLTTHDPTRDEARAGGGAADADAADAAVSDEATVPCQLVYYRDGDGDGYGAVETLFSCSTDPPLGYSRLTGDCCDEGDGAESVHPGQTSWFSEPSPCALDRDYDCNGAQEREVRDYDADSFTCGGTCDRIWWCGKTLPECGENGAMCRCLPGRDGHCVVLKRASVVNRCR